MNRCASRIGGAIAVGAAAATLAGCASQADSFGRIARDPLIVPGERIGEAALGISEGNLLTRLGVPSRTYAYGSEGNRYVYEDKGLWVVFTHGRASGIAARREPYKTAEGIGIGSPELELRAAWGAPALRRELGPCADRACNAIRVVTIQYCYANGAQVEVDAATRRVRQIGVSANGCGLPA